MIFIDMDGVLCDLVLQIERYLGVPPIYNSHNYGTYFLQKACPDITFDQIKECFELQSFWLYMDKLEWADTVINWVENVCHQDDAYILTCPWNVKGCECTKGKVKWIADHYPQFADRIIFSNKKEMFANAQSILIDDNKTYCENFANAGGKTIFIPTPWGDTEYGMHPKKGIRLVEEVLECQTKLVESMLR